MATWIAQTLSPRQKALDRPVPARWVGQATGLAAELAADAGASLVHADLHYDNILAGTRRPWLAIDPKAIAGKPELSIPELMWTVRRSRNRQRHSRLLAAITRAAALDPAKARAWTIVRATDYWLWAWIMASPKTRTSPGCLRLSHFPEGRRIPPRETALTPDARTWSPTPRTSKLRSAFDHSHRPAPTPVITGACSSTTADQPTRCSPIAAASPPIPHPPRPPYHGTLMILSGRAIGRVA